MGTYNIAWSQERRYNVSIVIEADSKEEALRKFKDNEFNYDDLDFDEVSSSSDKREVDLSYIIEIKERE